MTWPARHWEIGAFAVFCLLNLLIPLCVVELFPFSRAPMFADAPRRFCRFTIYGPTGDPLPLAGFALQRNYWGNPLGVGCGFRPPESLDRFGTVPTREEVVQHIQQQLTRYPALPFVDVTREIVGATDENKVGVQEWTRWRIMNPHFREESAR